MFAVEISLDRPAGGDLAVTMATMREWLDHQRVEPVLFRHTAKAQGVVFEVVFASKAEADAFAQAFGGMVG